MPVQACIIFRSVYLLQPKSFIKLHCRLLDVIRNMEEVDFVEMNQRVSVSACKTQNDLDHGLWGLERISRDDWVNNYKYEYNEEGKCFI